MTTYYVDPTASGDNNGTSWDNAWTSIQSAADVAVAKDIVYCRNTQTLGATIDFDTQAGTNADGWIYFIGCNSQGNVDGTRFTLDANGGSFSCVTFTGTADMVWMENIRFTNTGSGTYHGVTYTAQCDGGVFINCCGDNVGGTGFNLSSGANSRLIRCVAYSCGGTGIGVGTSAVVFCASRDNGVCGFDGSNSLFYGCIAHGNTDDGFMGRTTSYYINCVADGNTDDGYAQQASTSLTGGLVLGCRITNHSGTGDIGLNANSEPIIIGYSYFENNDGDNIQNLISGAKYFIPIEGGTTTTNIEDQSNTNQGYVYPTNHDFSTGYTDSGDPDLRRTAITVPWS